VGASLLAMRPLQPTSLAPDTPPSRAGSLPHFLISAERRSCGRWKSLWDRACSRRTMIRSTCWNSPSAPSPSVRAISTPI